MEIQKTNCLILEPTKNMKVWDFLSPTNDLGSKNLPYIPGLEYDDYSDEMNSLWTSIFFSAHCWLIGGK